MQARTTRAKKAVLGGALAFLMLLPAGAWPRPPQKARIVEGVRMAGVRLSTRGARPGRDGVVNRAPFARWGRVRQGWCFEQMCAWNVPGGGAIDMAFWGDYSRVAQMMVTAPGWRTRRKIGPGSRIGLTRRRYRSGRTITGCERGPLGSELSGWAVPGRAGRGWTLFETRGSSQRVYAVRILRPGALSGC